MNSAPLLVDEYRRSPPTYRIAEFGGQGFDLLGRLAIAFEEDEAPGIVTPQELQFRFAENQSAATQDPKTEPTAAAAV